MAGYLLLSVGWLKSDISKGEQAKEGGYNEHTKQCLAV
jgi:hypothetical protein